MFQKHKPKLQRKTKNIAANAKLDKQKKIKNILQSKTRIFLSKQKCDDDEIFNWRNEKLFGSFTLWRLLDFSPEKKSNVFLAIKTDKKPTLMNFFSRSIFPSIVVNLVLFIWCARSRYQNKNQHDLFFLARNENGNDTLL